MCCIRSIDRLFVCLFAYPLVVRAVSVEHGGGCRAEQYRVGLDHHPPAAVHHLGYPFTPGPDAGGSWSGDQVLPHPKHGKAAGHQRLGECHVSDILFAVDRRFGCGGGGGGGSSLVFVSTQLDQSFGLRRIMFWPLARRAQVAS